jgi:hypothetical protein
MQTVTWSQDLHKVVKKVKSGGAIGSESLLRSKNFLSSFSLSTLEGKLVKKSFSTNSPVITFWWI